MTNRGKIYTDQGLEGYKTIDWYDSRGEYLGYDISKNGIGIQNFISFLEV